MMRRLVVAFIILLIISGCINRIGSTQRYTSEYEERLKRVAVYDPASLAECNLGNCTAMVCVHGDHFISSFTSYIGGYCYFKKNVTQDDYNKLMEKAAENKEFIHPFMIGQGSSIGDFDLANPYCSNRLSMAVHWLLGGEDLEYDMPNTDQALCLLGYNGIIPVYVLYSDGKNIDKRRGEEIAEALMEGRTAIVGGTFTTGPVGPVIIVPEINYNASSADEVIELINGINEKCNPGWATEEEPKLRCMIALTPKFGDVEALDAVMQGLVAGSQVHMIGFGIDSRYMEGCTGSGLMAQAKNWSSYIVEKYKLPTIIPYVLIDAGASDKGATCSWNDALVADAYSKFFSGGIISLQQRGVTGIALYDFNSSILGTVANPLGCVDCAVGKTAERMNAWFGGCQVFTRNMEKLPNLPGSPMPAFFNVFPTAQGGSCDFASAQYSFLTQMQYAGKDFSRSSPAQMSAPEKTLKSCGACLQMSVTKEPPFKIEKFAVSDITKACTAYPELDLWSARRGIDPLVMRANAWAESKMDPCQATKVCISSTDPRCEGYITEQGYGVGYDIMSDPSGICPSYESDPGKPPLYRYVGLGLTQILESPYTFWPANFNPEGTDGPNVDYWIDAVRTRSRSESLEAAIACNPKFNPFNASDAACMGTWKLARYVGDARGWINEHKDYSDGETNEPDVFGLNEDPTKIQWLSYFWAFHRYFGDWHKDTRTGTPHDCYPGQPNGECWWKSYAKQKKFTEDYCRNYCDPSLETKAQDCGVGCDLTTGKPLACYGYTDFFVYVKDCGQNRYPDVGLSRLGIYLTLIESCEVKLCPPGQTLYDEALSAEEKAKLEEQGGIIWNVPMEEEEKEEE